MSNFERPPEVRKAQLAGDKEALSAMGKMGGKASAASKAEKKDRKKEVLREASQLENAVERDGDILPPDAELD